MKILILTNKLPYPPRDGGSIATLNMLSGLRDAGNNITCLSLNTSKHAFPVEEIPNELSTTVRFIGINCDSSIKPLQLILNLLFSKRPYIAERFNIRKYRQKLIELLREESYDLVQMEGPYLGHYLNDIRQCSNSNVSLRAHNVEHLIWKRKAANEKAPLKRWYIKKLAFRLEKYEMQVIHESDILIPISPQDETYFRRKGYGGPIFTIPTGLSLEDYPLTPLPADPTIFFIGALDWLPNQEGLLWFLNNIFEKLTSEMPQLLFHVAGRNAPEYFESKLKHEKIIYHGEVDNARKFMQSYRIMVAPLLTGSGIRIKILEGMALGRPVVTTPVGIEGIPAENNKEVMVTDNPDIFKNQLVKLLTNETETNRLVTGARQLMKHNFDNFGLSSRLSQFFKTQV
ncbi:MAG: glycosyltransferase family 4 protein [Bacteroidota bacterium]